MYSAHKHSLHKIARHLHLSSMVVVHPDVVGKLFTHNVRNFTPLELNAGLQ